MKTKIIDSTETNFQPVTYQITFNTPDELAVFLAVTREATKISRILGDNFSEYFGTKNLAENKIRDIIDSLAQGANYSVLKDRLI